MLELPHNQLFNASLNCPQASWLLTVTTGSSSLYAARLLNSWPFLLIALYLWCLLTDCLDGVAWEIRTLAGDRTQGNCEISWGGKNWPPALPQQITIYTIRPTTSISCLISSLPDCLRKKIWGKHMDSELPAGFHGVCCQNSEIRWIAEVKPR